MALNGNVAGKLLRGRINSIDTLILSAYAIAVKNGYKGTEEEWLASLKGTSVTVKSVSASTIDGARNVVYFSDGMTLSVMNGSKGSTGAKGDKGDKGEQGIQGIQGEKGEPGEAGATGEAGKDGADGKSAYQYAQDGGFEGTEEEFAEKLAKDQAFEFTVTKNENGSCWASADLDTIVNAINAGKIVTCRLLVTDATQTAGDKIFNLMRPGKSGSSIVFAHIHGCKTETIVFTKLGMLGTVIAHNEYDLATEEYVNDAMESVSGYPAPCVMDYGAKGDGNTDDTVAFQTALAENRVVFVPGGTYKLSGELLIRGNCELEISQDTVLEFTQTTGNCISMEMSASIRGHHGLIKVPYTFAGNVINVTTKLNQDVTAIVPWNRWDPMWKAGRYITDLNITKHDSKGFCYANQPGDCKGTAIYISADRSGTAANRSTFIWGLDFSGIRIAGAFSYGIRAVNYNEAWNHEMRIAAFITNCEIGVSLEDCNNAYISAAIEPRYAENTNGTITGVYAKHGIQLIRSTNADLTGSRVWDWNATGTLWTDGGQYQHIGMYGDCHGAILNSFEYYDVPIDIRKLIYTDTASNLEKLTILQEPFTRWFKPKDNKPYFFDGDTEKELTYKEDFDRCFVVGKTPTFTDVLAKAIDTDGSIYNGIGYSRSGGCINGSGAVNSAQTVYGHTGFIVVKAGSTVRVEGMKMTADGDTRITMYDADFNLLAAHNASNIIPGTSYWFPNYVETENGFSFQILAGYTQCAYIRLSVLTRNIATDPLIAINEEIGYTMEGYLADSIKVKGTNVVGGGGTGGNVDLTGYVKTVNGIAPDKNGNVVVEGGTVATVEPADDDIPKVFFGGALQQTKDEAVVPFRYISKTDDFSGYAEIKAQGNSSMNYPKKNQTVKLFKDADCTEKLKIDFKGWGKQNKHVYKANWIDLSHARNVVSARLWADVVMSRADYAELPELLRTSPNRGAVDGFPVKVYAAGVYQGRYTLNIPKDKWTFNMDDKMDSHCVLCGENYASGCFRASAQINESDWTDEIHDTVPASIKTRWNEVISFVMNSTDEEFRANLGNYFFVDSLIDYYLFGLASCGLDAFGKNQIYATYDGQKWIASMYDMDSTWGLYWNGSKFVATDYARTSYEDMVQGRQGNLLYMRLEQLFYEELQARWAELKNGALSIENIINRFERFTDIAPADLVKEDYASTTGGGKFTGIPSQNTNNIQQIRSFALARQAWTDEYVAGLTPVVPVPCTGITLSAETLTYTEAGSQTLTATTTPDGCTDVVTWETSDSSVVTVSGGVVTAVGNGNATITARCGEYSASCAVAVSGFVGVPDDSVYSLPAPITFDGTSYIDTEYVIDTTRAFTICLDGESVSDTTSADHMVYSDAGKIEAYFPSSNLRAVTLHQQYMFGFGTGIGNNARFKTVVTVNRETNEAKGMASCNGVIKVPVDTPQVKTADLSTNGASIKLGAKVTTDGTVSEYFVGTIHDFKIYDRLLTNEEITAFLR